MKSANLSTWPEVLEEMTQNKECDSCHQTAPGLCDLSGQTFIKVKSFKNFRLTPGSDNSHIKQHHPSENTICGKFWYI